MLKFYSEDNGNCRVYFKRERLLYCWQDDGRGVGWRFYRCAQDGEPAYGVEGFKGQPALELTPRNPAQEAIGRELNAFLAEQEERAP